MAKRKATQTQPQIPERTANDYWGDVDYVISSIRAQMRILRSSYNLSLAQFIDKLQTTAVFRALNGRGHDLIESEALCLLYADVMVLFIEFPVAGTYSDEFKLKLEERRIMFEKGTFRDQVALLKHAFESVDQKMKDALSMARGHDRMEDAVSLIYAKTAADRLRSSSMLSHLQQELKNCDVYLDKADELASEKTFTPAMSR